MGKTNQIGVDIGERLIERMPDAGLGGEVHDDLEALTCEKALDRRSIGNIDRSKAERPMNLQEIEARLFQRNVVVRRHIVDAEHALALLQQARCEREADEPRSA